jgi:hypothetical protein
MVLIHGGDGKSKPYQYGFSNIDEYYAPGCIRHNLPIENSEAVAQFISESIIIYPEIINGNPLGGNRVVRYVLYFTENVFPGEFVCTFRKMFFENADHVLFKTLIPEHMNDHNTQAWSERTLDCTYFGKGPKYTECVRIPGTLLIERDWPRDQEQLALILKQSRFLYTFDCVSSTNDDALMCGCIPVHMHEKQITRDQLNQGELKYPTVNFAVTDGQLSITYSPAEIIRQMREFQVQMRQYEQTWVPRVRDFAEACIEHYSKSKM